MDGAVKDEDGRRYVLFEATARRFSGSVYAARFIAVEGEELYCHWAYRVLAAGSLEAVQAAQRLLFMPDHA